MELHSWQVAPRCNKRWFIGPLNQQPHIQLINSGYLLGISLKFGSSSPEKWCLEDDPFLLGFGNFFRGDVKLWGGYLMEDWRVKYFMEKICLFSRLLEDSKHPDRYDMFWKFRYPSIFRVGWKIPPRTKRCSTNYPIKKKFRKKKTWDINVVPPWNLKQQYIKCSKIQNPKCQVKKIFPGFTKPIYTSKVVEIFVGLSHWAGLPQTHVVLFHRSHITWFFPHQEK